MQIKVCGITDQQNMMAVGEMLPDMMGFIFYRPSPRDVSNRMTHLPLKDLPSSVISVALTVNRSTEGNIRLIRQFGFDAIQLHGKESPEQCLQIRKHAMVIKTFSVGSVLPGSLEDYHGTCDYLLFDTAGEKPGGNSITFDHALLKQYNGSTPFFIAGGIGPEDATRLKNMPLKNLSGADVNSRFEVRPGYKNTKLLQRFIEELRT